MKPPRALLEAIRKAKSVLLATHSPMDGDGLGCGLALMRCLRAAGKQVRFITEAYIPHSYAFLAGYEEIERLGPDDPLPACDLVLGLDAGEPDRLGRVVHETPAGARLANIDHHVSNGGYGDFTWVEAGAAATGEQVFALLQELGLEIDAEAALCLLVALVTDTGRFCYSNTTAHTLRTAAELVRLGADPDRLHRRLFAAIPLDILRLHSRAVEELEISAGGRLAMLVIPARFGADLGAGEEELKDLVDIVISVEGTMVGALVRGLPGGGTKVSLRSKSDAADVAGFATRQGGGGHIRAAGFSSKEEPEETARRIRPGLEALAVGAAR